MPIAARKNTVSENETPIDSTKYNQEIDNIYTVLNQVLKFYASPTSPENPQTNQTWLDTTTTPALLRRFDGTVWRWTGMYVGTTTPSNPIAGAIFIHGTTGSISSYTGSAWLPLGAEGVVFDPTGTILTATDVDAAIKELIVDYQAAEAAKEEALGAASNAGTYMGQAQSAKTAAETAQSGAQTARTGAETARTAAEVAQSAAETARDAAQSAAASAEADEIFMVFNGKTYMKVADELDMQSMKIIGVAAPVDAGDAVNKEYVDSKNYAPSAITQDTNNRFVTDAEKAAWNAKASTAVATTSANGLMSSTDKTKLNGVPSPAAAQSGFFLGVNDSGAYALVEVSTTWGAM